MMYLSIFVIFIVSVLYFMAMSLSSNVTKKVKPGILEPLLVYSGAPGYDFIQEINFREKVLYWGGECIDTTYFALEILQEIDKSFKPNRKLLFEFVNDHFNEKTGSFYQCKEKTKSTIYDLHCAIGIIKILNGISVKEPLGKTKFLEAIEYKKFLRIKDFVYNCFAEDKKGVCPSPGAKPTLTDTDSAVWVLWNLEEEIPYEKETKAFLAECLILSDSGNCGFSDEPLLQPWLCSTYYGLKIIKHAFKYKVDSFGNKEVAGIKEFLLSCKTNDGFSWIPNSKPTLMHTKFALSIIYNLLDKKNIFSTSELEDVKKSSLSFLKKCEIDGGYAFIVPDTLLPNVYTTRYALDIMRYLEVKSAKKSIIEFTLSCYNKETGAFSGYSLYPKDTRYIISENQSMLQSGILAN